MSSLPSDIESRSRAALERERNVVVTAGAGTGKTTLLVERIVHLLLRSDDPIPMGGILALTFSRRAAGEMRARLREVLMRLLAFARDDAVPEPSDVWGAAYLQHAKGKSGAAAARLRDALAALEDAQVGTIHSFAASLLRAHPIESGVDPGFREDDGTLFEERFARAWREWLAVELGPAAPDANGWRELLARVSLEDLAVLARALCGEEVDLGEIESGACAGVPAAWRSELAREAVAVLAAREGAARRVKADEMVASALELLGASGKEGRIGGDIRASLARDLGKPTKGWDPGMFSRAGRVVDAAKRLCEADDAPVVAAIRRVLPFARDFRPALARAGIVSFDGLLVRSRNLLRDRLDVRERLKARFRAILVDEFQDTDPLQYEILLFLAERPGGKARSARDVKPQPGRLFIVGDPKQSIYAFRRADIEAYHDVVERQVGGAEGAATCDLTQCFRMHERLVAPVNAVFSRLIVRDGTLQPGYVALHPRPVPAALPSQRVEVRLAVPPGGGTWNADAAHAAEAEALARWMRRTLLAGERIVSREGERAIRAGDIAILFRTMTPAPAYLEALRRWGIPSVVDGEKSFYRTQEVADFLSLLRVLAWPHDALAVAGVLRSPVGGMTDAEVAALGSAGGLDWMAERDGQPPLYAVLRALREKVLRLPAGDAVEHVLEALPVVEAVAAVRGEQAASNLRKIAALARAQGTAAGLDFPAWVRSAAERMEALETEGESPLAEESADAVRVLTIHKAKGLEFPVVIVPAMQSGRGGSSSRVEVRRDWATGTFGIRVGDLHNGGEAYVREREDLREEAEQKRLFYVAATRARERLVLSGARTSRLADDAFLSFLEKAAGGVDWETPGEAAIALDGAGLARVLDVVDPDRPGGEAPLQAEAAWPDPAALLRAWEARRTLAEGIAAVPRSMAPSRLGGERRGGTAGAGADAPSRDAAAAVGTAAHRILARLDFADPARSLARLLDPALDASLPPRLAPRRDRIRADLEGTLRGFLASDAFAAIARSRILGREVPCLVPAEVEGARVPVDGAIDLILDRGDGVVVLDYKTDRIDAGREGARAEAYRAQGEAYVRAASAALGRPAAFEVVFLRTGAVVRLA